LGKSEKGKRESPLDDGVDVEGTNRAEVHNLARNTLLLEDFSSLKGITNSL
jgi:hypothetical protein